MRSSQGSKGFGAGPNCVETGKKKWMTSHTQPLSHNSVQII